MSQTKPSAKINMFFSLLRSAMTNTAPDCPISPEKWGNVYNYAEQQRVVGLAYQGICLLPVSDRPPRDLFFKWSCATETVQGQNRLLNGIAARLTEMFAAEGFRSAILKGPANARLYPDPTVRQCGDIDIWVEGGRQKVIDLLQRLGLFKVPPKIGWFDYKKYRESLRENVAVVAPHHIHLKQKIDGVSVEVHFKPSSGILNPFANKRLQRFLEQEIEKSEKVAEGFCVPSVKFALIMQLSHIQRHFFVGGVGIKQLADYYVLLQNASDEERTEVSALLHRFGMYRTASAVMWVLDYIFKLDTSKMLCEPNRKSGKFFLQDVLKGGAFGSNISRQKRNVFVKWFMSMHRPLQLLKVDPVEALWCFISRWIGFLRTISIRLRARKLVVRRLFQKENTIAKE